MLKTIYLSLFLCTVISTAFCQATHRDSLTKAAKADAKTFRLDDAIWKKYKRKLPSTSDHFKPTEANQKNRELLTDSVYVKAYRQATFNKNKHRRTPWHYVLVGGSIAGGLFVAFGVTIIILFAE
jgi:hypothetical protein